jgi:hypothetical protein
VDNRYDFNRDHKVNTLDVSLVRSSQTTYATALKVITVPADSPLGLDPPTLPTEGDLAKPQAASMDALAATVAGSSSPRLGAGLGTALLDALAAAAPATPL